MSIPTRIFIQSNSFNYIFKPKYHPNISFWNEDEYLKRWLTSCQKDTREVFSVNFPWICVVPVKACEVVICEIWIHAFGAFVHILKYSRK